MTTVLTESIRSGILGSSHRARHLDEFRLPPAEPAGDAGEELLADWIELCPDLAEADLRAERLRVLGLTTDQLRQILLNLDLPPGEPAPAGWATDLAGWYDAGGQDRDRVVGLQGDGGLMTPLLPAFQGAIDELHEQVHRLLPATGHVLGSAAAVLIALTGPGPLEQVGGLVLRTMVLELNVARVEDRLAGTTPQERFGSFTASMTRPETIAALWAEYPTLARLVAERLRFWIDTRVELLANLIADRAALLESGLLGAEPGALRSIRMDAGDGHRRGRSVAVVAFENATVVYKPRSLAIDLAFDRLLGWFNESALRPGLRRLTVLDRPDHGWVEHIDSGATTDEAGVDRFAYRLGLLSALLHALNATDFHLENVMAEGDQPVLVDLESVIHVELAPPATDPLLGPAHLALNNSIYATGLVPAKILAADETGSVAWDFSAIGGRGGQLSPFAVGAFDADSTDTMRYAPRRIEMKAEHNLPITADGRPADLLRRRPEFEAGFQDGLRLLISRKEELAAADGPLAGFEGVEARHIARPTNIYARLLADATHPDYLRTGPDRDRVLCRLSRGLAGLPFRELIFRDELAELRRGDIPVFTVDLGDGTVRGGDSGQFIWRMQTPPLQSVRERIRQLDESALALQTRIVELAFASASMSGDRVWTPGRRRSADGPVDSDELAEAARRCARTVVDLAISDGSDVGWIGLQLQDERHWMLGATEYDLYSGITGIAVGLDAVAAVTADPLVDEVALQVLHQTGRLIRAQEADKLQSGKIPSRALDIGALGPLAGTVYALATTALRRGDPELAAPAELLLPVLDSALAGDEFHDVIAGTAGTVLALLALAQARPGSRALEVAGRAAEVLHSNRIEIAGGYGWPSRMASEPMAGLSHGASGIALALARYDAAVGGHRYRDTVLGAIGYEYTLFDHDQQNWRDVRDVNPDRDAAMVSWCHGAGGIAAVRTELQRLGIDDPTGRLSADRTVAARTVAAMGLLTEGRQGLGNHSLCHGDLGNLLILQDAVDADSDPKISQQLPTVWAAVVRDGDRHGWRCGVPTGAPVPGLMCGLSGIAWGLARAAAPHLVPNVLTLAAGPDGGGGGR